MHSWIFLASFEFAFAAILFVFHQPQDLEPRSSHSLSWPPFWINFHSPWTNQSRDFCYVPGSSLQPPHIGKWEDPGDEVATDNYSKNNFRSEEVFPRPRNLSIDFVPDLTPYVFHFVVFRYILWISLRFVLCHRKGILLQMARHSLLVWSRIEWPHNLSNNDNKTSCSRHVERCHVLSLLWAYYWAACGTAQL